MIVRISLLYREILGVHLAPSRPYFTYNSDSQTTPPRHQNRTAQPLLICMANGLLDINARFLQKHVVQRRVVPHVEPVAHL